MSGIKVSFNGASIIRPGFYWSTNVNLVGGFPLADTGIVAILGEADKGEPGSTAGVVEFTSEQLSTLIATYGSGRIVDAARILAQPSRSDKIQNGAQKILVYKTNASTQASASIHNQDDAASAIFDIDSLNYGLEENYINFYITQGSTADAGAVVTSSGAVAFPIAVANNDTLIVDVNGTNYTCTVSTAPAGSVSLTQSQWVTLLNGVAVTVGVDTATPVWDAAKPCIFAASGTDKLTATLDKTTAPFDKYEKMWEYGMVTVETSNIATKMVFTGASTVNSSTLAVTAGGAGPVRGSRGGRIFVINSGSDTETTVENDNEECFRIRYLGAGTACTMTISGASDAAKILATTCAGAGADDLSLTLADYETVQDLVNYINNFGGGTKYKCVSTYSEKNSQSPTVLDRYDAIDIKTLPLGVKCALYEMEVAVSEASQLVSVERKAGVYGQVETIASTAREFLSGAVLGASSNTDFQNGHDALLAFRANYVVPLISQDASADITDGETAATSSYTIDSVNAQAISHCLLASNTKNRSPRRAYISKEGTFANVLSAVRDLTSERASMAFQSVDVLNTAGELVTCQPWAAACVVAGIRAGAPIGEPATYKYCNIFGVSHQDFSEVTDIDTALENGLLVISHPHSGGYRLELDNTTYMKDANFVWNRGHMIDAADYIAYDLKTTVEAIYIGNGRTKASSTIESIKTTVVSKMNEYLKAGITAGDSTNGGLGYKDLVVSMTGSTVNIDITLTLNPGVDFVLTRITLDNLRDSI